MKAMRSRHWFDAFRIDFGGVEAAKSGHTLGPITMSLFMLPTLPTAWKT